MSTGSGKTRFKLCLFGDGGVGKSTLTYRYLNQVFEPELKMTIGADLSVKHLEIEDKTIGLQIWDFGGEERYRVLFPSFAQGADGGIFIFDTTRYTTLNRIEDWLSFFKDSPKSRAINIPIIMVGAKTDLDEKRSISSEDAMDISEKYGLSGFFECSSKSGQNVDVIFESIAKIMMENAGLI